MDTNRIVVGLFVKVVRSGDLISYCAEEGVRILGQGTFLVSDSFPGNERTKYCLTSKVISTLVHLADRLETEGKIQYLISIDKFDGLVELYGSKNR